MVILQRTVDSGLTTLTYERYPTDLFKNTHSLGFVHNNLNPGNVIITEGDTVVIIDFDSCVKLGELVAAANVRGLMVGVFRWRM